MKYNEIRWNIWLVLSFIQLVDQWGHDGQALAVSILDLHGIKSFSRPSAKMILHQEPMRRCILCCFLYWIWLLAMNSTTSMLFECDWWLLIYCIHVVEANWPSICRPRPQLCMFCYLDMTRLQIDFDNPEHQPTQVSESLSPGKSPEELEKADPKQAQSHGRQRNHERFLIF